MPPLPGTVAVIGSGIIGLSWAVVFARAGYQVRIYERRRPSRPPLSERLFALAEAAAEINEMSSADIANRCTSHADLATVCADASHVQEAAPENLILKKELFAELDRLTPPATLIASSTSGLPISTIAGGLAGRDRCIVAHPATPPHLLPVVEIVPADFTPAATTAQAFALMQALKLQPVLINKEQAGFVLNRLQVALLKEMFAAIADGVISATDADRLISDGFGLRWAFLGPLAGIDLNAPGGITDYLQRYQALFTNSTANTPSQGETLTPTVIAELGQSLRQRFPLTDHPHRIAHRDRSIAALRALKIKLADS